MDTTSASEYQMYAEIGEDALRHLFGDDETAYREVAFRVGKDLVNRFVADGDEARRQAFWNAIGSLRREAREAVERTQERHYADKLTTNGDLPEHDALVVRLWYTAGALLASRLEEVQRFREQMLGMLGWDFGYLSKSDASTVWDAVSFSFEQPADSITVFNLHKLLSHLSLQYMKECRWTLWDVIALAEEKSASEVDAFIEALPPSVEGSITVLEYMNHASLRIAIFAGWSLANAFMWLLHGEVPSWPFASLPAWGRRSKKHWFDGVLMCLPAGLSYATVIREYKRWSNPFSNHRKPPSDKTLRLAIDVLERRMLGEDWKQIAEHHRRRPSYLKRDVLRALHGIGVRLHPEQL